MLKEHYRKNLIPWLNGRTMMFTRLYAANIAPTTWIILMSSFMLTGCGDMSWTWSDFYYRGTLVGYQQCLDKNKDLGVSEKLIRSLCLDKHEKSYNSTSSGSHFLALGYHKTDDDVKFIIKVLNLSKDIIITSLDISLAHKQNIGSDGKPIFEELYAQHLWIESAQIKSVEFSIPQFKPSMDRYDKDSFEWHIRRVGGLRIVLR